MAAAALRRSGATEQEDAYQASWLGGEAHVGRLDALRGRWWASSFVLPLSLALAFTAGGLVAGSVIVLVYRARWRQAPSP